MRSGKASSISLLVNRFVDMKFEKKTKKVAYVKADDIYRVTNDPVTSEKRKTLNPSSHLVGVTAAVTYWDIVDRREHCLGCARTIKEAWDGGDRYMLDTDKARHAAELVADLASMHPVDIDICSALVDLLNAISEVRMNGTPIEEFDVLDRCERAIHKCYEIPDFKGWSAQSRKRRFLYELPRKDRNQVVYTLMGLYFGYGATPLLTSKQKHELLSIPKEPGPEGAISYFDTCLKHMTAYKYV